jgi:hypothetical protein
VRGRFRGHAGWTQGAALLKQLQSLLHPNRVYAASIHAASMYTDHKFGIHRHNGRAGFQIANAVRASRIIFAQLGQSGGRGVYLPECSLRFVVLVIAALP